MAVKTARCIYLNTKAMSDTNFDTRVFYNEGDDDHNKADRLTEQGLQMVRRLVSQRGFRQLAEVRRIQATLVFEVQIFRDWEQMPDVAKDYQSEVAGDCVEVDELEALDVKASGGSDDPALSFEERDIEDDGADVEIDSVPFW